MVAAFAVCVLALASCVAAPHPDSVPNLPFDTPEGWTGGKLSAGEVPRSWPSEFGDAKLVALIDEAFKASPDLKAASARLMEAEAIARIAGADLYPQLTANLRAARAQQVFDSGSSPFLPPGTGGPIQSRSNQWGVSLDMTWELDVWGRVRAGTDAATADMQAAVAAFEGARLSMASQVAKAYVAAVSAKVQARIASESLTQAESLIGRVRDRYTNGVVTALDLRLSESTLESAKARVAQAKRLQDSGLRQLEILIGRYPSAATEIADTLPSMPARTPGGLPMDLLSRRPDLVEAERRYVASGRRLDQAKASRLPRIALTASAGTSSGEAKNLLNGNYGVWSLAANLAAPVFDGGRLKGAQDAAEAREIQAAQGYVARVIAALGEVEVALSGDAFLADEAEGHARAAAASKDALSLSQRRYDEGVTDILTVLRSRQDYYAAQGQEVAARTERLIARINLFTALGGGFGPTADDQTSGTRIDEGTNQGQ